MHRSTDDHWYIDNSLLMYIRLWLILGAIDDGVKSLIDEYSRHKDFSLQRLHYIEQYERQY